MSSDTAHGKRLHLPHYNLVQLFTGYQRMLAWAPAEYNSQHFNNCLRIGLILVFALTCL